MVDRQNLVSFVERALLLKTLPVLNEASPDQIAAILGHAVERSFAPGTQMFRAGEAPAQIHVLVEGRVRVIAPGGALVRRAGELVGMLAALEQRPHAESCVADTPVHTLTFGVDDLLDLLEDFFDLTRSLLGYLARQVAARGGGAARLFDGGGAPLVHGEGRLDLIDLIVFLKGLPFLAGATVNELAELGNEVADVRYRAGELVAARGQPADAFHLVVRGAVGGHGPRGAAGVLAVLMQGAHAEPLVATEPSRVLRVPAERFFDLLEDHFDLTLGLARLLSGALRAAPAASA